MAVKNNENVLKIALRLGVRGGSEATDLFKNLPSISFNRLKRNEKA
jgi:hypothetical protein